MAKIDPTKLTRDQKLLLFDILEEKKRRKRERRASYVPNEGQSQVHKSAAEIRIVTSGNGSGKTTLAVQEALWAVQGWNPVTEEFTKVPCRVIVVLDHPDKVNDVWIQEIRKWYNLAEEQLHKRGKAYYCEITFPNGSQILFLFHQQEPMIFESIELDYAIMDEPCPRHIWIALRRGGRKKGRTPRYLLIGTPIAAAWVRTDLITPWTNGELPEAECFRFGTKVNEKNLADGYIEAFSRVLSEKERRVRLEGEFFDLSGLALAHLFDRTVHVIDPFDWPEDCPVVIAIDPHPRKKHVAVMMGADKDGYLYYIKEFAAKLVPREFAEAIKEWYAGYRVIDIVVDSLGSADGTGGEGFKSFISVLNDEGIRARATNYEEKQDEAFISRIQDALAIPLEKDNFGRNLPKLRIFRGNNGIINDIENVNWVRYKNMDDELKPKLDITNKDFLSGLKYALATNIRPNKHKDKIYRRTRGAETYGQRKHSPQVMKFKSMFRRNR